jgi:aminoglycoside phosphotransferase (APT) family kinase protein
VDELLADPTPLLSGLRATPQTLVHGDWKAGNLGSHPDGCTILLDWALTGIGPGCLDLAWYICLNRVRLPESKEATIQAYRDALERHGIDTRPWWEQQVRLSLLSMMLMFGWEKALGDDDELGWWQEQVTAGTNWLDT